MRPTDKQIQILEDSAGYWVRYPEEREALDAVIAYLRAELVPAEHVCTPCREVEAKPDMGLNALAQSLQETPEPWQYVPYVHKCQSCGADLRGAYGFKGGKTLCLQCMT